MSVNDFMKGLPIHDSKNFTHLSNDHGIRTSQKRASIYLPTEDVPEQAQLIVMDKRCVLLRYLTQQWDKKTLQRKREHGNDGNNGNANSTTNGSNNSKKRPRYDGNELNWARNNKGIVTVLAGKQQKTEDTNAYYSYCILQAHQQNQLPFLK